MAVVLVVGLNDETCLEYLRAQGFIVRGPVSPEATGKLLDDTTPDLVIIEVSGSQLDAATFIRELRFRLDDATSIIVISGLRRQEDRVALNAAGADFFLPKSASPSDVAYEMKRALILRRSGRRLGWNWQDAVAVAVSTERRRRTTS